MLVEELLHQRNHDDGGRQVVQNGAEKEGDKTDQPHQCRELGGPDARGDDLETVVSVNDLDDGHRPHQEKDDLRRPHQRFAELLVHQMVIAGGQGVNGPEQAGPDQGGGRLVDLERMFQGDGGVGDNKDEDNGSQHEKSPVNAEIMKSGGKLPRDSYIFFPLDTRSF